MNREINQVTVERDDGHKKRWAFGSWFYRQEGPKTSIEGRRVTAALAVLFGLSVIYLLVKAPSQGVVDGESIPLENSALVSKIDYQNVPEIGSSNTKSQTKPNVRRITFGGVEHVERPRLTSIPPGLTARAKLLGAATDGSVRAELIEDLVFNGDVLLPRGIKLIGSGSSGEDRLKVGFTKAVFADGKTQTISAEAVDVEDQVAGLKGARVSKYAAMVAAAGALSFAGGVAEGLQEMESNGNAAVKKSNLRNAALNGAARATIDASTEIVTSWKNKKSTIIVKEGSIFVLVFNSN